MIETPPRLRRSARRLRLAALFGIALIELLVLFAAWVLAAGRQADFPALAIQTDGLRAAAGRRDLAAARPADRPRPASSWSRCCARSRAARPSRRGGLRGFARYLFLAVLASVFAPPLIAAVQGAHRVDLALGGGQALMLIVTGLLFFVARLLDEARRLADDHSQIV